MYPIRHQQIHGRNALPGNWIVSSEADESVNSIEREKWGSGGNSQLVSTSVSRLPAVTGEMFPRQQSQVVGASHFLRIAGCRCHHAYPGTADASLVTHKYRFERCI